MGRFQLELAEGPSPLSLRTVASKTLLNYILVPDPENFRDPVYVREDVLYGWSENNLKKLFAFSRNWNTDSQIRLVNDAVTSYRHDAVQFADDYEEYVETADAVVEIIDTVVGWFGGSGGSGGSGGGTQPVGSIVNANGLVACVLNKDGVIIGFGVHPARRQIIAFSNPQSFTAIFPNLPSGMGSTIPWVEVPVGTGPNNVPQAMVDFALSHPDQLIRFKSGGGYEVVPNAGIPGYDGNGNPSTEPPLDDDDDDNGGGDDTESRGSGSLITLGVIGALISSIK